MSIDASRRNRSSGACCRLSSRPAGPRRKPAALASPASARVRDRVVADDRDVDRRDRQVDVELDPGDGEQRRRADPRVADVARDHLGQRVAQAVLDALPCAALTGILLARPPGPSRRRPRPCRPSRCDRPARHRRHGGDRRRLGVERRSRPWRSPTISAPPADIATGRPRRSARAPSGVAARDRDAELGALPGVDVGSPTSLTNTPTGRDASIRRMTMRLSFSERHQRAAS